MITCSGKSPVCLYGAGSICIPRLTHLSSFQPHCRPLRRRTTTRHWTSPQPRTQSAQRTTLNNTTLLSDPNPKIHLSDYDVFTGMSSARTGNVRGYPHVHSACPPPIHMSCGSTLRQRTRLILPSREVRPCDEASPTPEKPGWSISCLDAPSALPTGSSLHYRMLSQGPYSSSSVTVMFRRKRLLQRVNEGDKLPWQFELLFNEAFH